MNILVDANIFLAVIMNEPEKKKIVEITKETALVSPDILPYEIGNALSAMGRRGRLEKNQILKCFEVFKKIPVRLVSLEIERALEIAASYNIYAYDAYYLETARRLQLSVLTLDQKMKNIAADMNLPIWEVV